LAITAVSQNSEILILGVNSSFQDEKIDFGVVEPDALDLDFKNESGLVHRQFRRLSQVLVASRENSEVDGSIGALFEALLELDRVLNVSTTIEETKKIIEKVMHNYTDSWGRRTLRMVSEAEILRISLSGEAGTAAFLVEDFRWNVAHELLELRNHSEQWCKDVANTFLDLAADVQVQGAPQPRPRGSAIAGFLAFVAVVESAALVLYARRLILEKGP
jgi:hypothetical protein